MTAVPRGASFSYASSGVAPPRTSTFYESAGISQPTRSSFTYESSAAAPRSSISYETTRVTPGYTTGTAYASGAGYVAGPTTGYTSQYGVNSQFASSQVYRNYEPDGCTVQGARSSFSDVASPSRYPRDSSRRGVETQPQVTSITSSRVYGKHGHAAEPLATTQHLPKSVIDGYSAQVGDGYTYTSSDGYTVRTKGAAAPTTFLRSSSIQQLEGGVTVMDGGVTSQPWRPQTSTINTYPVQSQSSTYSVGSIVEYNSKTLGRWIMAKVEGQNEDGTYALDCKPQVPAERIRWPLNIGPNGVGSVQEPDVTATRNGAQPKVTHRTNIGGAKYKTVYTNGVEQGHVEPETDSTRSGSSTEPQIKLKETVLYRCPECNQALPTLEEAVAHCSAKREAAKESAQQAAAGQSAQAGVPRAMAPNFGLPEGTTLVECDRKNPNAEPVITRQVDPDTGVARTIVREEDGSERVFGENTVQSLIGSGDETAEAWVDALTMRQLRGLVHEVGQRLITYSGFVQGKIKTRNELQEELNYMALGLSPHVSSKELESAYKRLARAWHPDKNGGTEEAKQRFQYMKERYEALRASRKKKGLDKCGYDGEDVQHPFKGGALEDGEAPPQESDIPDRKEAYDEDEPEEEVEAKSKDPGVVSYDPNSRESLNETIWKMMKDLRSLDTKIQSLDSDIEYLEKETSGESQTAKFGKEMAAQAGVRHSERDRANSETPKPTDGNEDQAAQAFAQVQEPESYAEPVLPPKSFCPGKAGSQ